MAFLRQVFVIMAKDLRAELRTKEAINASFAFALVILSIVVGNFAMFMSRKQAAATVTRTGAD